MTQRSNQFEVWQGADLIAGGSGTDEYLPITLVKVGTHPNGERDTAC